MSVTSGFFNSLNGDRKYNAEQMSAIFDGIINDGILANIGTAFSVTANEGLNVNVGIGRAWFNSTWIYNDAILPITLDISEVLLDRIDAVVIEVDRSDAVRAATIKVVKGTPSSTPQNPTMASTNYVHQYPLAYIYRTAGSTAITQSNITNAIGTSSTPYVTGILQVQSIDNIVAQWKAQWVEWFASQTNMGEAEINQILSEWDQWYQTETTQREESMDQWSASMQAEFNQWFDALQVILEPDVATNLAAQIVELQTQLLGLAKDKTLYNELTDYLGNPLLDSYEGTIMGTTVFNSGAGDAIQVNQDLEALRSGLLDGSFIPLKVKQAAKQVSVEITATWSEQTTAAETTYWSQIITVPGITSNTEVSISLDTDDMNQLLIDGVSAMWVENNDGACVIKTLGSAPTVALTLHLTLTEVGTE